MIIRPHFLKSWKNHLFLCKFHTNLLEKSLINNKLNNYLIRNKQKYYSKQINNDWTKFELNNDKGNLVNDFYREETFPLISSLNSLNMDEIQSHSHDLLNFNNDDNNNSNNAINSEWFETLSFAERLTNYPTSFLSLRFLLKDEISYLAVHLKRIIDTKHPLLQTAKNILSTSQQLRGLVVLLLSKSYNYPKHILDNFDSETNRSALINKHQRKLAEITDMIHVSQVLHRGIINLPIDSELIDSKLNKDLHLGNTISVLIGDYLLGNAFRALAILRNTLVVDFMSKAIENYSEAEFLKLELSKHNNSLEMLEEYCYLSAGSLLAHSCKSAVLLAEHKEDVQCEAFEIGKHIGIAFQLSELLNRLLNVNNNNNNEIEIFDIDSVKSLLESNTKKILALIENLGQSEASLALSKIVMNIENVEYTDVF